MQNRSRGNSNNNLACAWAWSQVFIHSVRWLDPQLIDFGSIAQIKCLSERCCQFVQWELLLFQRLWELQECLAMDCSYNLSVQLCSSD